MKEITQYLERIEPANVLALLPTQAVELILGNFSERLSAGVALLYPKRVGASEQDILHVAPQKKTYHAVCKAYRANPDCDEKCRKCDAEHARKYLDRDCMDPQNYQCHLRLWDMAFPLFAGDAPCGVIFGGQILLNEPQHIRQVEEAITAETPSEHQAAVRSALVDCTKLSAADLDHRFREFCSLGMMLQGLVSSAYDKAFEAAFHSFLVDAGVQLTVASAEDETKWWFEVAGLAQMLCKFTDLRSVLFFSRKGSRYLLKATESGGTVSEGRSLPTELVVRLDHDVLQPLPAEVAKRLESVAPRSEGDESCIFFGDLAANRQLGVSTAVVLVGKISARVRPLLEEFCRLICLRADVTNLILRIGRDANAVRERVRNVLHHTKNPLQRIVVWLEDDTPPETGEGRPARERILDEALYIRECLKGLHATTILRRTPFDLKTLCEELVESYRQSAAQKYCTLVWVDPPSTAEIEADQLQLRIAIENLLDNAVKYSWHGTPSADQRIRLTLSLVGKYTQLKITNYGVGIPPHTLRALREAGSGERGDVPDKVAEERWREERYGSGLGVPISKRIIEAHGGWIDIGSWAADADPRPPDQQFHRYLTSVSVNLPLMRR